MDKMKDLKEVLAVIFSLVESLESARMNDGKIDYKDIPLLLDPAMKLPAAADGIENVYSQWKSATEEERAELYAWAKSDFDIANDKLEAKIEAGLNVAINLGQLFA